MTRRESQPHDEHAARDDHGLWQLFVCCDPALSEREQVAYALDLVIGLATDELARAFLVSTDTMAQRLAGARDRISHAGNRRRIPAGADLPGRLPQVLRVIYLVFNEGYTATMGSVLVRATLCLEAIALARMVCQLLPDEPEAWGLLALLLLIDARRPTRTDAAGDLVVLAEQDRTRWSRDRIAEGRALMQRCRRRDQLGPLQIQAAINLVHADAPSSADTDWRQIVELYDQLHVLEPSPVVALNRVVALAEADGPATALEALVGVGLEDYPLYHATRADFLARCGRTAEAIVAYRAAQEQATNEVECRFLRRREQELGRADGGV